MNNSPLPEGALHVGAQDESAALPETAVRNTAAPRHGWSRATALARATPTGTFGLALVTVFALLALFASQLSPYDPIKPFSDHVLAAPGKQFWLGTDGNGMDVLSRTIYGTRYAFGIAVPVLMFGMLFGIPLGLYAGYRGGWVDEVALRGMDALRVFPSVILAIAIVAATGPSLANVVLVIGILDVPVFARLVRAEVLSLRAGGFVEAAVNAGNPTWRILFVHLLPNCLRGAMAQMPIRMAWAVRASATLAFIGVGIQVPTPEWGAMIHQGAEYIISGEWWVSIFPGLALVVLIIGFSMLGDGLEGYLDPRRNQRAR
jgi:peptide/nickel transport system permease protein